MNTVFLKTEFNIEASPEAQRQKFENTIEEGFWRKSDSAVDQVDDSSNKVCSSWQREFDTKKKPKQILKTTRNLVERAAEYADILDLAYEIAIEGQQPEKFTVKVDKPSNYFKEKSWK